MICLVIVVIVGWILVTISGALSENGSWVYWVWLVLGTVVLCCILAGVAFYLAYAVNSIRINRRQANFIDAVTHELKSPMASLRLGLETMSRRKLSSQDMDKFTKAMKKDVHRLDRLISHLLNAAGLHLADGDSKGEVFDVCEVIKECIADVCTYHEFPETSIQFSEQSILHFGPVQDFEIVFRNLIDNAVKYCGKPPVISINVRNNLPGSRIENNEGVLIIEIENNGVSVPDSERQRVFQRFERTGIELERTKPGVGLGLFIVKMLLKRHQGRISLENPNGEEGTRVVVELPIQSPGAGSNSSTDLTEG
ncbi:MAG: HAMP domain-containing sensor histidine kinase [Planctomycetota bacterium]|nr:HAMP domain-containing sensor histidine kinase [Planctomycetota bacterium]